jgi:ATP-dependent protease Clp ATPase subunit
MLWTRTYVDDEERCSFCHRKEPEAGELICAPVDPRRYICAACVEVCKGILEDRNRENPRLRLGESVPVKYNLER